MNLKSDMAKSRVAHRLIDENVDGFHAWLYGAGGAPSEKFIRVDYDPHREKTFAGALQVALTVLANLSPALITPGHSIRIIQDLKNSRIIARLVPSERDANEGFLI